MSAKESRRGVLCISSDKELETIDLSGAIDGAPPGTPEEPHGPSTGRLPQKTRAKIRLDLKTGHLIVETHYGDDQITCTLCQEQKTCKTTKSHVKPCFSPCG